MTDAEKQVREAWEQVSGQGHAMICIGSPVEGDYFTSWQAALAFTLERKEQIRQLKEEINLVNVNWSWASEISSTAKPIWQRVLTRLQAQLTELKKGMKEQHNGK